MLELPTHKQHVVVVVVVTFGVTVASARLLATASTEAGSKRLPNAQPQCVYTVCPVMLCGNCHYV